jgi:hypothetical protein
MLTRIAILLLSAGVAACLPRPPASGVPDGCRGTTIGPPGAIAAEPVESGDSTLEVQGRGAITVLVRWSTDSIAGAEGISGATVWLTSRHVIVSEAREMSPGKYVLVAAPGRYELGVHIVGGIAVSRAVVVRQGKRATATARVQGWTGVCD